MVRTLRFGADTVELSAKGPLDPLLADQLDMLKARAQNREEPQPIVLAKRELFVQPRSMGHYPWVLRDDEVIVRLRREGALPTMAVRFLAYGLVASGLHGLWSWTLSLASELGVSIRTLSRLDVYVDFQGWVPTFAEMESVRCPASFRPVYPSHRNPQTFQFGRGDVVVRVYDKTAEIAVSRKTWMKAAWSSAEESFEPAESVWRVEVQLRREVLKALHMSEPDKAFDNLGALLAYGLNWCSLGVANGDSNASRWPTDERWELLRTKYLREGCSEPLQRVAAPRQLMGYERALANYVGAVTSAGAALENPNYLEVVKILYDDGEILMNTRGKTFAEFVEHKRRRHFL